MIVLRARIADIAACVDAAGEVSIHAKHERYVDELLLMRASAETTHRCG